jgi:iron complex transport system substrate-binding protein
MYLSKRPFLLLISGVLLCLGFFWANQKGGKSAPEALRSISRDTSQYVRYAKGFSIDKRSTYTLISVFNPFQNHSDTLRYILIPRGGSRPAVYPNAQTVHVPIRSLIATSTTQIGVTEMLHANNVVKGMVGAKYAYSPDIRERLREGKIKAFQGGLNKEVALNMHPDVVMLSSGQASQYNNYRILMRSGITVFVNANWLEPTPLGKAEWMKAMGLLLGKEQLARKKFKKIASRYNRLKAKAQKADNRPLVINNLPYKGAWFVSGGRSYMAQYFRDAGAKYPWSDNQSSGGLRLSFESIYNTGLHADVWLDPGSARTKADILAVDSRLKAFKPFKTDQIYNNNKRMSPSGGNDFWEKGVVRPDLILADLIRVLHPGLLPDSSLYFYRRVE